MEKEGLSGAAAELHKENIPEPNNISFTSKQF